MPNLTENTQKPHINPSDPLLWSIDDIIRELGVSRTKCWRIRKTVGFPPELNLPGGCKRWFSKEIREWAKSRQKNKPTLTISIDL